MMKLEARGFQTNRAENNFQLSLENPSKGELVCLSISPPDLLADRLAKARIQRSEKLEKWPPSFLMPNGLHLANTKPHEGRGQSVSMFQAVLSILPCG